MREKILSYKGTGVAEMVVCGKLFFSYTVRREAEKEEPAVKNSHAEHGKCEICAKCTKMDFQKKGLKVAKMAVLDGVFRYIQWEIT